LIAAFSEYGSVKRVQIPKDRETGRLRGFGFVEMSTDAEEAAAIEALDGEEWMGRDLKVNKAKPREERSTSSAWRLDSGIAVAIGGESNIRDDKSNRQQPADPGQKTTPNSQHQPGFPHQN
jgi:RNA recognition motif-containing protein